MQYFGYFIGLLVTVAIGLFTYSTLNKKPNSNTKVVKNFKYTILCMILWCLGLVVQILVINYTNINPLYIDYFIYIPVVFTPVFLFFVSVSYTGNESKNFKKWSYLASIIPFITIAVLWTNDFHKLFYKVYSIDPAQTVFGPYFYVHSFYTYALFIVDIIILLKNSIKKFGTFSRQSLLISLGSLIPVLVNITGMTIFKMNIYVTPISFLFSIILISIAILKYNFLNVTPIALKKIVNQMSDLYVVLNHNYQITDCNRAFENAFNLKKKSIVGKQFKDLDFVDNIIVSNNNIGNYLEEAQKNNKIFRIDARLKDKSKYFNIEVSGIFIDSQCVGILILFKDTTQHVLDMETLKQNQNTLMERERLATLGQMIGGIAHNLKTPIMSIAGAMEGMSDLVKEYEQSIGDPEVNSEDHHAIAKDMQEWIDKVNSYDSYMSDIITAVKGQSVNLSEDNSSVFTVKELLSRINILMKHELKNAFITLNVLNKAGDDAKLIGNINSLVQVVNNLISNAIQAYNGKPNNVIDLIVDKKNDKIMISVVDHGCGIPKDVQEKLFNKMVTTKGHNGTGLGLFMSYSTIKGHFKGDMDFTSKVGVGTTFNIVLPI